MSDQKYDLQRKYLCGCDFIIRRLISLWGRLRLFWICAIWGVEHAGSGRFIGPVVLRNTRRGKIRLGRNVVAQANFRMNPIGPICPCLFDVRPGGEIEVGDGTGMTSVIISSRKKISIGRYCKIGGVEKKPRRSFHSVRRTFATQLSLKGIALGEISELLGHRHIRSDKPYLSYDREHISFVAGDFTEIPLANGIYASLLEAKGGEQ